MKTSHLEVKSKINYILLYLNTTGCVSHTWWGDRSTAALLPSWLLYLVASCTQTTHEWDPGGQGSAGEPGWWPVHATMWCSGLWQLRHIRNTLLMKCGRSRAQTELGTDWQWRWAGGCCCSGTTWWQPLSAADHTPTAPSEMQELSVNKDIHTYGMKNTGHFPWKCYVFPLFDLYYLRELIKWCLAVSTVFLSQLLNVSVHISSRSTESCTCSSIILEATKEKTPWCKNV